MLDHITLHVSDIEKSKKFFLAALKPLGYEVVMEFPKWKVAGLGAGGKADLWLNGSTGPGTASHIAFVSPNQTGVNEFYKAALAAGGKDNGTPGPRLDYSVDYYGGYVLDFDGNNIEVVSHTIE